MASFALPVAGSYSQVSVLLAEDHPVNRMAVEYILETLPVSVVSVSDGAQAVEAGASEASVKVIDAEDIPIAYLPGKARRVRVRVVGDIGFA